jgi:hypothetical protein
MIQVYADNVLAYDSRLEEYDLVGLKVTTGLNIGGTAEITMPPGHPAFNYFIDYRTIVTIYRDGALRFRGRALYSADTYHGQRTITCEGEMCLFRDGIFDPFQGKNPENNSDVDYAANIFTQALDAYNSQVEEFKRFELAMISLVPDGTHIGNGYVRLSDICPTPLPVLDVFNKLVELCGGYMVFSSREDGTRGISWLSTLNNRSRQEIEFGENLLDFSSTGGSNTQLATGIIPYGPKDPETGDRMTIQNATIDGLVYRQNYIIDEEAQALRGTIMTTAVWENVWDPVMLYDKAKAYLSQLTSPVTALTLTAMDLSHLDKDVDSFRVGDLIRVKSAPHRVDEYFQLSQLTEDLLDPSQSTISLGKSVPTLTGKTVSSDAMNQDGIHKATEEVRAEYNANMASVVEASETTMTTLIQQTSESIMLEVAQEYAVNEQLMNSISTKLTQLEDRFLFEFETLRTVVAENDAESRDKLTQIYNYISFDNGDIRLGGSDSPITLTVEKDLIVFKKNGQPFGWWDGVDFHTGNIVVEVNERAQFGNFAFVPRSNGSLSFLKVGG